MRDDQRGPALHHPVERVAPPELGLRIHARSGLIKNQNLRTVRQRSRETDQLLLSRGESRAALAHFLFETAGQSSDEVGEVDVLSRLLNVRILNARRSQSYVAPDRAAE